VFWLAGWVLGGSESGHRRAAPAPRLAWQGSRRARQRRRALRRLPPRGPLSYSVPRDELHPDDETSPGRSGRGRPARPGPQLRRELPPQVRRVAGWEATSRGRGHGWSDRCRRAFVLPILQSATSSPPLHGVFASYSLSGDRGQDLPTPVTSSR